MDPETEPQQDPLRKGREGSDMPFSPRTGCALSVLFGAFLLCVGLGLFQVVMRSGLTIPTGRLTEVRIWPVESEGSQGLGMSTMHRESGSIGSGEICLRTTVHFLFREGSQQNTSYCECFNREGDTWRMTGRCPE